MEKSKKFHASIAKLMNNLSMSRAAQALLNKKAEIVENGRDPDGDKEKREIFWAYAEAQQHGFHLIIKWHPHICYTCRKAGEVGLDLFWRDIFQSSYLFSWGEIPGNDSDRLIDFLKQNYSIDWIEKAEIKKIDDVKTISISVEKNSLSLSLNDEKTKVDLKIDDVRTDEFIANMENGKLNIYETLDELVAQYPFCKTCIEKVNEEAMCLI